MPPGPGGFGEARDVACQYLLSHRYALGAALALLADAVEHSPDVRSLEGGQLLSPRWGTRYSLTATSHPT
jgi:hypothetical protein